MDERTWLNRVWAMAEQFGWKAWHVAAPMRGNRTGGFVPDPRATGLPDLFLLHDDPPRLIMAELKGDGGHLSDRQRDFLNAAKAVAEQAVALESDEIIFSRDDPVGMPVARPVGVYAWWPKDEAVVEQILRSRVLV